MPAWWGWKSHKKKSEDHGVVIFSPNSSSGNSSSFPSTPVSSRKISCEVKTRSFDESLGVVGAAVSLRSPGPCPGSGYSSRFSGFESEGGGSRECHPLPRPSVSSSSGNGFDNHGGGGGGGGVGGGFGVVNGGSVSASSVSSSGSGSTDDTLTPPPLLDQLSQFGVSRGIDNSLRSRSPGPGSRVPMASIAPHSQILHSSSPLHPQWGSSRVESPTGKMESQCHPLPLPPTSPTSPVVYNPRASLASDNTSISPSSWKKGKLLGRGTFGHVYLGFNSEKGRLCAIKEVNVISDDQNARESLKQLNQEINLLSQLSHPNIVRYYGSELGEETLSVYLEYVSGGSIHKLLQEYGPFKVPVIQNYTRQILSGLAYLHARKTVHRDIKGANILVDPNGGVKLADFGMAKHMTNCASVLSFKGSPYWMAPEVSLSFPNVVMHQNGYSLAVDIWSLGCTILEMATSKPPWSQYEGVAAIFKIGNSRDIPEIPSHLSNSAKSFLRLCLQRDPSLRPSATELLEHPFLVDQSAMKISIPNMAPEPFPMTHDGTNRLKVLDIHPHRKSISYEPDTIRRPAVPVSRDDNARTITSLPVSPCSSPLRQRGSVYKSCFLSPPHPSYGWAGQISHHPNKPSLSPTRSHSKLPLDPWHGSALCKTHTPGGSPRSILL
ncbi:hypothetical protein V2J09_021884 [Rumex salicifolius]